MQTIQLNISDAIFDKVMFFLSHLPKNMIQIQLEKPKKETASKTDIRALRGVFHDYATPSKQQLEEDAWKQHIIEKYKSNND